MVEHYLERIGLSFASLNKLAAVDVLSLLHTSHLYSVPFENLDIHLNRPILLAAPAVLDKILQQQRGGFCYELNLAFSELLKALGFKVSLISAQVYQDQQFNPDYDHLCLVVQVDKQDFLVDVGFGDSFTEPLAFSAQATLIENAGYQFKLEQQAEDWVLYKSSQAGEWQAQYRFRLIARQIEEFQARCDYHQYDALSHFKQKVIASIARPNGRFTLSNNRQILRTDGHKEEDLIPDSFSYGFLLEQAMGISLNPEELRQIWQFISP